MARKKYKTEETVEELEDAAEFTEELHILEEPVVLEPSLELAVQLEGHPKEFHKDAQAGLAVLFAKGIAADFGEDGWARGHRWRAFVKQG